MANRNVFRLGIIVRLLFSCEALSRGNYQTRLNSRKCRNDNGITSLSRRHSIHTLIWLNWAVSLKENSVSWAISPEESALSYDSYAYNYDILDGGKAAEALGIEEARGIMLKSAKGSYVCTNFYIYTCNCI